MLYWFTWLLFAISHQLSIVANTFLPTKMVAVSDSVTGQERGLYSPPIRAKFTDKSPTIPPVSLRRGVCSILIGAMISL